MKRLVISLLCLSLSAALWASGGQEGESAGKDDHMTISFGYWQEELFGGDFDRENDALIRTVEDKFNVTIEPKFVNWADYKEKYRLWAAAGELPDFFAVDLDDTTYQNWIKQGVLRSLPDDLSAYPELEALFARPDVSYLAVDGQFYHIPRFHSKYPDVARGVVVRKDWMKNLGISEPESWDEFRSMIGRFINEDPDGNGMDDSIGIMVKHKGFVDTLINNFNPSYHSRLWVEEGGRWIPYFMSEKMPASVALMGDLHKEGLLYEDFILMTEANAGIEKFAYGNSGALLTQCDPPRLQMLKKAWVNTNPDKPFDEYVEILPGYPFPDAAGERNNIANLPYWSSDYFSSSVSDEKMGRILKILNFLNTEEGYDLWYRGIEGSEYRKTGDGIEDLRPLDAEGNRIAVADIYPSALFFGGMAYWGNDRTFFNEDPINYSRYDEDVVSMAVRYAHDLEATHTVETDYNISEQGKKFLAEKKFSAVISDDVAAAILAEDSEAAWEETLAKYKKMGIDTIIEEFNSRY